MYGVANGKRRVEWDRVDAIMENGPAMAFVTMVDNLIAGGQPDHARRILQRTKRLYPRLVTEVTWEILESWLPKVSVKCNKKVVIAKLVPMDNSIHSSNVTTCEVCGESISILLYFTHQETHE